MSLRSEHAAQQAQIADLKGQLARALAPSERVDFGVQKSGPRRANDRPHGTEGIASMQDTPYANGGDLYRVEDRGYVTPCWVWLRHIQPNGYGATNRPMSDGRRTRVAHRWMYDRHVGPIPEGLEIDHLCRVRCCVNPDQGALEILQPWLVIRSTLKIAADAPLFCTILPPAPGRPLWQAQVRKRMHELGAIAGIPKRVHPHGLRHSLAVDLLREGAPMPYIQRQLGHSSLATTATYLSGLGAMEHVAFVSAREWPGGAS